MGRWPKRLKMMRISKFAIIICLLLAIVFAGFTVYGARTGNFVIFVQPEEGIDIQIYMKEDKSDIGTHLSVPTLKEWTNYTYGLLRHRDLVSGLGPKNDDNHIGGVYNRYMCFSFMIVNMGERDVDFLFEMTISDSERGSGGGDPIKAMRVNVIEEENKFEDGTVYAFAEETEEGRELLSKPNEVRGYIPYETKDFITLTQVCSERFLDLKIGEERKFTVIIWLEGQDIECVDNLFGGRLQMRLDITGVAN